MTTPADDRVRELAEAFYANQMGSPTVKEYFADNAVAIARFVDARINAALSAAGRRPTEPSHEGSGPATGGAAPESLCDCGHARYHHWAGACEQCGDCDAFSRTVPPALGEPGGYYREEFERWKSSAYVETSEAFADGLWHGWRAVIDFMRDRARAGDGGLVVPVAENICSVPGCDVEQRHTHASQPADLAR